MSLPVKPVSRDKARRDTFISLKKTCRKLGVSFWDYLNDRIAQAENASHLYRPSSRPEPRPHKRPGLLRSY
jgi:hypothetical protein